MGRFTLRASVLALTSLTVGCVSTYGGTISPARVAAGTSAPVDTSGRLVPLPDVVRPVREDVELWLDTPKGPSFRGNVALHVDVLARTPALRFHGEGFVIERAWIQRGSRELPAFWHSVDTVGTAELHPHEPLEPGPAIVHVAYRGAYGASPYGLRSVTRDGVTLVTASFEPFGARRAFPCFDEPRFKIPFTISIVTAANVEATSNAAEERRDRLAAGRVSHRFRATDPIAPYQIAIAAGDYEVVERPSIPPSRVRSWPIPLRGFSARGTRGSANLLDDAARIALWLEEQVGLPLPLHKLDLVDAPGLQAPAMESPGAFLFREPLVTSDPESIRVARTSLAHELAHAWFGDAMTHATWDDLWLTEGLATYFEQVYADAFASDAEVLARPSFVESRWDPWAPLRVGERLATHGAVQDAFDDRSYGKPARIFGAVMAYLGAEGSRRLWSAYARRAERGLVTRAHFFAALAEVGGAEVARAFEAMFFRDEAPVVRVRVDDSGSAPMLRIEVAPEVDVVVPPEAAALERARQVPVCVRAGFEAAPPTTFCVLAPWGESKVSLPWASRPSWARPHLGAAGAIAPIVGDDEVRALLAAGLPDMRRLDQAAFVDTLALGLEANVLSRGIFFDAVRALASRGELAALQRVVWHVKQWNEWAPPSPSRNAFLLDTADAMEPLWGSPKRGPSRDESSARSSFSTSWGSVAFLEAGDVLQDRWLRGGPASEITLPAWVDAPYRPIFAAAARLGRGDASAIDDVIALQRRRADTDEGYPLHALRAAPPDLVGRALDGVRSAGFEQRAWTYVLRLLLDRPETRPAAWSWWLAHGGAKRSGAPPDVPFAVGAAILSTCDRALLDDALARFGAAAVNVEDDVPSAALLRARAVRCAERRDRVRRALDPDAALQSRASAQRVSDRP